MVKLEEVPDEEFITTGEKVLTDDEDDYTDTDSEISDDEGLDIDPSETLYERIVALKDMVPPTTRRRLATGFSSTASWTKSGLWFGAKAMYVISTSALLIAVPFGIAYADELQQVEFERDQKMREMGNEMLAQGAPGQDSTQVDATVR